MSVGSRPGGRTAKTKEKVFVAVAELLAALYMRALFGIPASDAHAEKFVARLLAGVDRKGQPANRRS